MSELNVRLLGGIEVVRGGRPLGPFPSRWAVGVLAYLALHQGRLLHRNVVAAQFWPEESDAVARRALRRALWGLRTYLGKDKQSKNEILLTEGSYVGLLGSPAVTVDIRLFDEMLGWCSEEGRRKESVNLLEEAVRLYRGDFLEGFDFEWSVPERERLRLAHLAARERLMDLHMYQLEWSLAVAHGEEILRRDPLREHVHRGLMNCHCERGNRPLAIRQYQQCERILAQELGIAPMEATQRVFRQIHDGSESPLLDRIGLHKLSLVKSAHPTAM